jgi:Tol biopolymer transport system component
MTSGAAKVLRGPRWLLRAGVVFSCVALGGCSAGETGTADAGGPIVYSNSGAGPWQLYIVHADGTGLRKLSNQDGAMGATVSPGGRLVAFSADGIWTVRTDGTEETPLRVGMSGGYPVWSPSGEMLLFWSGPWAEAGDLEVIDVSEGRSRSLTRTQADECCYAWSADGNQIFFARQARDGWTLHAIDPDGTDERQLGRIDADPAESPGVVWSPDGERVLFERTLEDPNRDELPYGNAEIFVANSDGTDVRNLTRNDADDRDAAWSPDGEQIAFVRYHSYAERLWIMNADGEHPHPITKGMDEVTTLAWASNGGQITFGGSDPDDDYARTPLWVVNVDGTGFRKLTPGTELLVDEVGWTPRVTG